MCGALGYRPAVSQDLGPFRQHAKVINGGTLNGMFLSLSGASQYVTLPQSFLSTWASTASFTSSAWVYINTVCLDHAS